jgi:hypothetical protein
MLAPGIQNQAFNSIFAQSGPNLPPTRWTAPETIAWLLASTGPPTRPRKDQTDRRPEPSLDQKGFQRPLLISIHAPYPRATPPAPHAIMGHKGADTRPRESAIPPTAWDPSTVTVPAATLPPIAAPVPPTATPETAAPMPSAGPFGITCRLSDSQVSATTSAVNCAR